MLRESLFRRELSRKYYHMEPTNKSIKKSIIAGAALGFFTMLAIGWIGGYPMWNMIALTLVVSFTVGGAIVGALVALLFLKVIYPQLGIDGKKSSVYRNMQASPAEKKEMHVEYELNTDDALAFHLYNYEHSPQLGRARKLLRRALLFAVAVELLAAILLVVAFGKHYLPFVLVLCAFALLTLLYYVFSPSLMRKGLKGAVVRNYGQRKDKLTGKHKLSIAPDAVTDITDMGESTTRWDAIEWIASTDQYLFMMVRGSGPHIVPRRAFADDAPFKQFIDTAKAYYQAAIKS